MSTYELLGWLANLKPSSGWELAYGAAVMAGRIRRRGMTATTGSTARGLRAAGFSLPELLIVLAVILIVSAMAVPVTMRALQRYRLDGAARAVGGQIRSARLAAVTLNRVMRIRFNCPAASVYRVVEVTGDPAIDGAADRCSYPWPDPDPITAPNADRPQMFLADGMRFGATSDLTISTRGLITPVTGGAPVTIEVTNGTEVRQITVSTAGRVQTP